MNTITTTSTANTMTNSTTGNTGSTGSPPTATAHGAGKDARQTKKGSMAAFKGLVPFLRPYRRQFALAGISLVVAACSTLAIPAAFKQMIDLGFGAGAG